MCVCTCVCACVCVGIFKFKYIHHIRPHQELVKSPIILRLLVTWRMGISENGSYKGEGMERRREGRGAINVAEPGYGYGSLTNRLCSTLIHSDRASRRL